MPLMECPDCGGVVSDHAITCPTCNRVMGTIDTGQRFLARRLGRWALGGAAGLLALWVFLRLLA